MEWETIEIILKVILAIAAWILARPWSQQAMEKARQIRDEYNLHKAQELALSVTLETYQTTVKKLMEQGSWNEEAKKKVFEEAKGILTTKLKEQGLSVAKDVIPVLVEKAVKAWKGAPVEEPA
jgi:hypothetical protein